MRNFIQPGEQLPVIATADLLSGGVVVSGLFVGVCETDIATGEEGIATLKGVHRLNKVTGALTQGVRVYWDVGDSRVTSVAADGVFMGYAWKAALSADEYCEVLLGRPGIDTDT